VRAQLRPSRRINEKRQIFSRSMFVPFTSRNSPSDFKVNNDDDDNDDVDEYDSGSTSSGSSSSSSSSSATTDSLILAAKGTDSEKKKPSLVDDVDKIKRHVQKTRPVYEDYMPASSRQPTPQGNNDDDDDSDRYSESSATSSSSTSSSTLSAVPESDEAEIEKRVKERLAKVLNAKKKSGGGVSGKTPKGGKVEKKAVGKKQKSPKKQQSQEAVGRDRQKAKASQVRDGSGKSTAKRASGSLTFKQRKQLKSWVKQATQYLSKVSDAVTAIENA